MKISDYYFFLKEALIGIKRSFMMAFISVATISVSLFIFGIFLLITINFNNLLDFVVSKLEIRVYFSENITKSDIIDIKERLEELAEVRRVEFISKKRAWEHFSEQFSNIDMQDLIDKNPLPDTLRIRLRHTSDMTKLKAFFAQIPKNMIEDISYGEVIANRISLFANFAKLSGLAMVALLTFATLLIIVNTIRLTVLARKDEIEIMQLVGATDGFIEWPFLLEGFFIGITGSIISIAFLKTGYFFFAHKFQQSIPYFPLVFEPKILYTLYLIILATGIILGMFGAYLSVSKALKQKL
ncbi:permease-like cell division protein FtsX [Candidatus Margulisiibacteriota bacterium]